MVTIAPSILAADISRLGEEVAAVDKAGCDWIHIDVMDGSFVPPITFGDNVVAAARKTTSKLLDVHLMIERPEDKIEAFVKAGADRIIVHVETCPHLHRVVQLIKEAGKLAGVAVNPATPVSLAKDVLPSIDLLLVMTVNPGWGGQAFIPETEEKIRSARQMIEATKKPIYLEVDGGIKPETARKAIAAGADVLVAGTSIFGTQDYKAAIEALRK